MRMQDLAALNEAIQDPRYWRDRDPKIVATVSAGFSQLYASPRPLTLDDYWAAMTACARVGVDDPDVHARAVVAVLNERAGL